MKTAEQIAEKLWEKHQDAFDSHKWEKTVTYTAFLAALQEYGELVRQMAAGVAREHQPKPLTVGGIIERESCAASIERMELP